MAPANSRITISSRRLACFAFTFCCVLKSLSGVFAIITIDNEDSSSSSTPSATVATNMTENNLIRPILTDFQSTTIQSPTSTTTADPPDEKNLILQMFLPALLLSSSSAPSSKLDGLDAETRRLCHLNPADNHCYLFVNKIRLSMPHAEKYCNARNMSLAHVTPVNVEWLQKLIDDDEDEQKQSKPRTLTKNCNSVNSIVIVANIPEHLEAIQYVKYGTYAYLTTSSSCAAPPRLTNEQLLESPQQFFARLYRMCGKFFDCTRVDWLQPNPFICVTRSSPPNAADKAEKIVEFHSSLLSRAKQREIARANSWCMKSVLVSGEFEYFVTCEAVEQFPPKLLYPPMCVPIWQFDFQQHENLIERIADAATIALDKTSHQLIEFLSIIHFYQDKLDRLCSPAGTKCADTINNSFLNKNSTERVSAETYGLCRREVQFDFSTKPTEEGRTPKFAQLWPSGIVPIVIGDEFPSDVKHFILKAMMYINFASGACVELKQITRPQKNDSTEFACVLIAQASDNDCSSSYVGRQGGFGSIQTIYLGRHCTADESSFLRPLLNVLGLPNEHTRSDRDRFVETHQNRLHRYDANKLDKVDVPGGGFLEDQTQQQDFNAYDYESAVELPSRFGFSTDDDVMDFIGYNKAADSNKKLIEPGRAKTLSPGDKKRLQFLYGIC